jgi:hypothetical protein
MAIHLRCPCGQELRAQDEHAGRKARCPKCGAESVIPGSPAESLQAHRDAVSRKPSRDFSEEDEHVRRQPDVHRRGRREDFADDGDVESDRGRPTSTRTSGNAWASLVLGFMSFGCNVLTGIPAIILATMSFRDIGRSRGRVKGRGVAITAIVISIIGMLSAGPVLLVFAVYKVRQAAARISSSNNLMQIGLSMHNYNDTYGALPPGNFKTAGPGGPIVATYGKPGLSWRVALLPFLVEDGLYRQFHLDEPWDSPHNKTLLTKMPKVYAHPSADAATTAAGFTHYRAFTGPHTLFDPTLPGGARIPDSFPDGISTTIFVVEASEPVEWTKPDDLPFGPGVALPKLGVNSDGRFLALMGDATIHGVSLPISDTTLRAAITRDGGDALGPDW